MTEIKNICQKTGRNCHSYDQYIRRDKIKSPECIGCTSNREKELAETYRRTAEKLQKEQKNI
jgi:hypothetical protein